MFYTKHAAVGTSLPLAEAPVERQGIDTLSPWFVNTQQVGLLLLLYVKMLNFYLRPPRRVKVLPAVPCMHVLHVYHRSACLKKYIYRTSTT